MRRICETCRARVRAVPGRWVHDDTVAGVHSARAADEDHRVVAIRGEARPLPKVEAPPKPPREPRRPAPAPMVQVVWGPPMRFERWPFNPDRTRLVGCAEAAGTGRIGEL